MGKSLASKISMVWNSSSHRLAQVEIIDSHGLWTLFLSTSSIWLQVTARQQIGLISSTSQTWHPSMLDNSTTRKTGNVHLRSLCLFRRAMCLWDSHSFLRYYLRKLKCCNPNRRSRTWRARWDCLKNGCIRQGRCTTSTLGCLKLQWKSGCAREISTKLTPCYSGKSCHSIWFGLRLFKWWKLLLRRVLIKLRKNAWLSATRFASVRRRSTSNWSN